MKERKIDRKESEEKEIGLHLYSLPLIVTKTRDTREQYNSSYIQFPLKIRLISYTTKRVGHTTCLCNTTLPVPLSQERQPGDWPTGQTRNAVFIDRTPQRWVYLAFLPLNSQNNYHVVGDNFTLSTLHIGWCLESLSALQSNEYKTQLWGGCCCNEYIRRIVILLALWTGSRNPFWTCTIRLVITSERCPLRTTPLSPSTPSRLRVTVASDPARRTVANDGRLLTNP